MPREKEGKTKEGGALHYATGAVIERDGKYLLIDRAIPPPGFAGPAGHVDEGEDVLQALAREVKEEVGLDISDPELLFEEELHWNLCSKGVTSHHWHLFKCNASGEIKRSEGETHSVGWYTKEEIKNLKLEPVWEHWFRKLNVI